MLAIHAHIRELKERDDFDVEANIDPVDPLLDMKAKLALYRIVQEALSNVRRHAGARRASVSIQVEGGTVVAQVEDPGTGFVPTVASEGDRGLGLIGMRERATMIGGALTIESELGSGTRVRVSIPVTTESNDG